MTTEKRTTYNRDGRNVRFDYYTANAEGDDGVFVYGWGTYGRSSVLAGQAMKMGLDHFDTIEEARKVYGDDLEFSSRWTEPGNSVGHLPGEDDPVAGGMYLDDYDDGY